MEMAIAQMSMNMAAAKTQDELSIALLKKSMESSETSMEIITDMLDNIPSPDGRGLLLDARA